jgi:hypothetical protein
MEVLKLGHILDRFYKVRLIILITGLNVGMREEEK